MKQFCKQKQINDRQMNYTVHKYDTIYNIQDISLSFYAYSYVSLH